jgi:hypothetical protein
MDKQMLGYSAILVLYRCIWRDDADIAGPDRKPSFLEADRSKIGVEMQGPEMGHQVLLVPIPAVNPSPRSNYLWRRIKEDRPTDFAPMIPILGQNAWSHQITHYDFLPLIPRSGQLAGATGGVKMSGNKPVRL